MHGIPPAKDSDAEDVVWGLQTADTLWKRGERIDAVVWLRRAAQAAGDEADDDRALELARLAAELSDWMASGQLSEPPPPTTSVPPQIDTPPPRATRNSIDVELDAPPSTAPRPEVPKVTPTSEPTMQTAPLYEEEEPAPASRASSVPPAEQVHAGLYNPWDDRGSHIPQSRVAPPAPPPPKFPEEEEVVTSVRSHQLHAQRAEALAALFAGGTPQSSSEAPPPVRPSAWAEDEPPPREVPGITSEIPKVVAPPPRPASPPKKPPPLPPRAMKKPSSTGELPAIEAPPEAAAPFSLEETARVENPIAALEAELEATVPVARPSAPPMAPMRPRAGSATSLLEAPIHAPAPLRVPSEPPPPPPPPSERPPLPPADQSEPTAPHLSAPVQAVMLDEPLSLEDVEAFADLPDDAREAFAAAARTSALEEGEEVSAFALAYVLSGSVDVAATMVDAPAARLEKGSVLRSRGTTENGVPMRLIGVESGIVATWTDAAVTEAFRTCPWVEEDLRVAADRWQTLVGVTIGALGERLDITIRQQIIDRLEMRTLMQGDVVVAAGEQMPGLFLVGVGDLELVDANDQVAGAVSSGDFLFPTEVLGMGRAPYTARAGEGGALILYGERMVAQELLVTCPPLLEVFAGM